MDVHIEVKGWENAQSIAKALVESGYEVLIATDGHILEDGERSYMIEYAHPQFTGQYFEIVKEEDLSQDVSGLPTWTELKEGLEHLDVEKEPAKKKKKKE